MTRPMVELVLSSPFILAKGFLMGFLSGAGRSATYFFSRRHGIQTETLAEHLKEWLGFENTVHLCLEKEITPAFIDALEANREKLGIEVVSCRLIKQARFEISARLCDRDSAERFRTGLQQLARQDLVLTIRTDREMAVPSWQDVGVGILTSLPPYQYAIDAEISGHLEPVLGVHARMKEEVLVDTANIRLVLGDSCLVKR